MKGTDLRATLIGCCPAMFPATNKSSPKGGVARPMDRQHTSTTPRWMGSTPNFLQAGSSTGTRMMMAGPVSITMPKSRKITTNTVSTATPEVKFPRIKLSTALVARVMDSTRPKAVANARTKANPP